MNKIVLILTFFYFNGFADTWVLTKTTKEIQLEKEKQIIEEKIQIKKELQEKKYIELNVDALYGKKLNKQEKQEIFDKYIYISDYDVEKEFQKRKREKEIKKEIKENDEEVTNCVLHPKSTKEEILKCREIKNKKIIY